MYEGDDDVDEEGDIGGVEMKVVVVHIVVMVSVATVEYFDGQR